MRPALVAAAFSLLACATPGCGELLGADDYRLVGDDCGPSAVADGEGACVDLPECGPAAIPTRQGECVDVGVPESVCQQVLLPDPERPGACVPVLPEPCGGGEVLGPLGATACGEPFGCVTTPNNYALSGLTGDVWVDAEVTPGGDGTRDNPFASIIEALAALPETGTYQVKVLGGRYEGNLVLDRPVVLTGACGTEIVGTDPDRPVVDVRAAAGGSVLATIRVTGTGSSGIRIVGTANVLVQNAWVSDIDGSGVEIEPLDAQTAAADITLQDAIVERARGAGIRAYGIDGLRVENVVVAETRPGFFGRGVGIALHASPFVPRVENAADWDPSTARRSENIVIAKTRVEGGYGAGVHVESSSVRIDKSLVRNVQRDDEGSSRGIAVERRRLGNLPADVEIVESVVTGAAEIGVWLDDATATIEATTIVDIGGAPDGGRTLDASALGNGVRVRRNRERDETETEPDVRILRSYIDGAHESSVHAEGAWVELERSIVGAALPEPLGQRFGDSIAAYAYAWSPARLDLTECLIRRGARTAVASFDAPVALRDMVIDSREAATCSGPDCAVRRDIAGGAVQGSALCQNAGGWQECNVGDATSALEPALLGFRGCAPDVAACMESCIVDLNSRGTGEYIPLPGVRWRPAFTPSIATAVTNGEGCTTLIDVPDRRTMWLAHDVARGPRARHPASGPLRMLQAGSFAGGVFGMTEAYTPGAQPALFMDREAPDLRLGTYASLMVCQPPRVPWEEPTDPCGAHRGVENVQVFLDDGRAAYYFGATSGGPDPGLDATSVAGLAYFYNVDPGRRTIRLEPKDPTRRLSCTTQVFDGVDSGALLEPSTNSVTVDVWPANNNFTGVLYCTLE